MPGIFCTRLPSPKGAVGDVPWGVRLDSLEEQSRGETGRSRAVGKSWEGVWGRTVMLLLCHERWKEHLFLWDLQGN